MNHALASFRPISSAGTEHKCSSIGFPLEYTGFVRLIARLICCGASLLILGGGSPLSARVEANQFASLLQNSPFGMEAAVPANEPSLEFRGYVMEEGAIIFSLVGPDANGRIRSAWVGLYEPYADCVVRSFDQDSNTVQVEQRGQTLTLKLKVNRVQLLQAPEHPVAGVCAWCSTALS